MCEKLKGMEPVAGYPCWRQRRARAAR